MAIAILFHFLFAITLIVGSVITIQRAIQKRSYDNIYKPDTKNEAKRLRATIFAITELEER